MKKIYTEIDEENLVILIGKPGFMSREIYPDFHEKEAKSNEVGSFLDFRFLKKPM